MADLLSPLRYPGSKLPLVEYFKDFLQANGIERPHLFEPYAGGASIALGLLAQDVVSHATLVERDPLVYAFWKCVKKCPDELCARIWKLDVSLETWKRQQRYLTADALRRYALLDLAVAGLFLNRTNFSGIIGAKPIGGMSQSSEYSIDCRFNKQRIVNRICDIAQKKKQLTICFGDAISFMRRSQSRICSLAQAGKAIVYIDPPYYLQGRKLYRYHYQDKQHRQLAAFLNSSGMPWLVSYDNHPTILELFKGQKIVPIFLKYTVKQNRRADELLITNLPSLPSPTVVPSETNPSTMAASN